MNRSKLSSSLNQTQSNRSQSTLNSDSTKAGANKTDAVPVKRQPLPKEERMFATVLPPVEPEPAGPSPETVLHDVNMKSFIQQRQKGHSTAAESTTGFELNAKHVPARVRANPSLFPHVPTGHLSQSAAVAGDKGARPSSGHAVARASSTLSNFDEELDDIRAQLSSKDAAPLNGSRSNSRFGRSPTPTNSGAAAAVSNWEDYEAIDRTETDEELTGTATGKPIYVPYTPDLRAKLSAGTSLHTHVPQKPMVLRDYQLLAEACQRAGRARTEGHAYYKIGEILARNKRDTLPKSITYFKRYLNIARRLNDLQGEAKALNSLGIAHYEMGGSNNWYMAIEYHKQHAEIADAAGIFVANTNLGLTYAKLHNYHASIDCHKQALQYAVRAGDKAAESLALANLGEAGNQQGDTSTAKVCVERHLELVTTLQDDLAACEAYEQLGNLAMKQGDFNSASENLLLALDVAMRCGEQERAMQLRCQVGFVQGMMRLDNQMKGTAGLMKATI